VPETVPDRDVGRAAGSMAAMGRWLQELRRRRVTHVALGYVAFVFVALQGGQVLFETLDVPRWGMRLLLALLMLGLPVAVLLAWWFDLTPQGLRQDGANQDGQQRRNGDRRAQLELLHDDVRTAPAHHWWRIGAIATLVVLAAAVWIWFPRAPTPLPSQASIAVLPFTSLSRNADDGYFAEGLAVELQDALAGVPGLQVAARTSAIARRNRDLDVKQLGATLGVATVLDASVRREGSRMRISARLSDTRTGFTLWAHSYESEQSDVFAMQSQIAGEVVRALLGVLPGAEHRLSRRLTPTRDLGAYDAYLKGQELLRQPTTEASLDRAIGYFDTAVSHDDGFARAQAGICQAQIFRFESVRDANAFERASTACARAEAMDPQLREVNLALGEMYRTRGDTNKAVAQYTRALDDPALRPAAYVGLAKLQGDLGHSELALSYFERARALRPGDAGIQRKIGYYLYAQGHLPQAIRAYNIAVQLQPDDNATWTSLGGLYLMSGDVAKASYAFQQSLAIKPSYEALSNLGTLRYDAGEYTQAAELYRRAVVFEPDDYRMWGNIGDALSAQPSTALQARDPYERAVERVQRYIALTPSDAQAFASLAWYQANLGRDQAARDMIAKAEAISTEQGEVALWAAQTFARLGDSEATRNRVAKARSAGISEDRIRASPLLRQLALAAQLQSAQKADAVRAN
jgi:TolB-like protein/Flp pilus assembly protein TadD